MGGTRGPRGLHCTEIRGRSWGDTSCGNPRMEPGGSRGYTSYQNTWKQADIKSVTQFHSGLCVAARVAEKPLESRRSSNGTPGRKSSTDREWEGMRPTWACGSGPESARRRLGPRGVHIGGDEHIAGHSAHSHVAVFVFRRSVPVTSDTRSELCLFSFGGLEGARFGIGENLQFRNMLHIFEKAQLANVHSHRWNKSKNTPDFPSLDVLFYFVVNVCQLVRFKYILFYVMLGSHNNPVSLMLDFWRITLFCLEKRFSKHKMTIFSKSLGAMAPLAVPLATPM